MLRSTASKVMWVGRATVFLVGLAVILALSVGVVSKATAHTGSAGLFHLGHNNPVSALSTLTKSGAGPALSLKVGSGPPLAVNKQAKVANLNADKVDGKDFSAFGVAEVIDTHGGLPRQGTYTSKGGTLLISASGSGYRTDTIGHIGMKVMVDGVWHGAAIVFTNEVNSHKAFIEEYIVVRGLPAGQHTIRLVEWDDTNSCNGAPTGYYCTITNDDDYFRVSVLEIPD